MLAREAPEQIDAFGFHLRREPLGEVAQGNDVIAVILKRRRRDRQANLRFPRQEVDVVVVDGRAERCAFALEAGNEVFQR
jgi:hypothetical protein